MRENDRHRAALEALIQGDHLRAEAVLARLVAENAKDARARFLQGRLAADRGDLRGEMALTQAAVDVEPDNPEYLAQLGKCHARAQSADAALALADEALRHAPLTDLTLDTVASIHTRFGRHHRAAEILGQAVAQGSNNPAVHFNLGNGLKFTGDFSGARRAFEQAIALSPNYAKAHAALASLGPGTSDADQLMRLEALIEHMTDPRTAIQLRHAAARTCEALKEYDRAWTHLSTGKRALIAAKEADPSPVFDLLDSLPAAFAGSGQGGGPSAEPPGPIFVVGMPRSGTTVVDRIVSNHSQVVSIGEFPYFGQLIRQAADSRTRHLVDAPIIDLLATGADLSGIGEAYLRRAAEVADGPGRTLDKMHVNFMLCGHILRALPQARILCLVRDPLDTIVGNFRQLFEFSTPIYDYALDPVWAARFYVRFRRLADLWADAAPARFLQVDYQALVADPQGGGRQILAFCGLDWEDGCERIENNTAPVATASAVQVRQPINADAIGRWRRYEPYLDEARAVLLRAGLAAG